MDNPERRQVVLSFDDLIDDSYLALPSRTEDPAPTIRKTRVVFSETPVLPPVWNVEVPNGAA